MLLDRNTINFRMENASGSSDSISVAKEYTNDGSQFTNMLSSRSKSKNASK